MLRTFGMGNYYPISTGTYGKLAKAYGLGTTNRRIRQVKGCMLTQ